jgi:hypothetical protein
VHLYRSHFSSPVGARLGRPVHPAPEQANRHECCRGVTEADEHVNHIVVSCVVLLGASARPRRVK